MARIPFSGLDGQPSPGTIGVPDTFQRIQADPSAFGAGIGQAAQGFGRTLEQAGGAMFDQAIKQHQIDNRLHDETAVTEALNTLQEHARNVQFGDPNDPNSAGYYGSKGRAALDGYPTVTKSIEDARRDLLETLQNPMQQQMFDKQSRGLTNSVLSTMGRHRAEQQNVWTSDTNKAAQANSLRDAELNYNSDESFTNHLADAVRATAARDAALGASPEVMKYNQDRTIGEAWKARILRTAADDPLAAERMLRSNMNRLDANTQTQLLEHLRPQVDKAVGDNILGGLTGQGNGGRGSAAAGPSGAGAMPGRSRGGAVIPPEQRDGLVQQAVANTMVPAPLLAGLITQESLWDPTAKGSGSDFGLGQILASTRRDPGYGLEPLSDADAADPAKNARWSARYLEARGKAVGLLTPEDWRDEAKVTRALRAYNGGGDANYAEKVLGHLKTAKVSLAGGGGPAPDASKPLAAYAVPTADELLSRADAATAGMPLAVQDHVRSGVLAWRNQEEARLRGDRTGFQRQFGNTVAALQDGRDVQPIEEGRIRSLYPPDQAEQLVEQQRVATATGNISKSVAYASAEQLNQMRQDVTTGVGPVSKVLAGRGAGAVPVDGDGGGDTSETYRLRRQAAGVLEERIAARQKQMETDPAAYAAQNPALAPMVTAAWKPTATPEQRAAAVDAVMAEQERLGVPEAKRRALPAAQIASDIHALTTVDPSKADMGMALSAKAAAYGAAWPAVFGSYVRAGLSPEYQAFAIMDRPDQTADRADMQRALAVQTERGGLAKLREAVGKDAAKTIDDGLDDKLSDFKWTVIHDAKSVQLFDTFRDSVRTLAYYKAMRGDTNALENAYQGVLGKRYDFDGTMRAPKGQMSDARAATREAVAGLKPEDMPVLASITPNLADSDKQAQVLSSIRSRGEWVPMQDDGGLELILKGANNETIHVTRADGKPVQVRFDAMRPPAVRNWPATQENRPDPATGLGVM